MKVSLLDTARAELKEAIEFYEGKRPGLGGEFEVEVLAALDRIQSWPDAWSRATRRTRMCRTKRFPYVIVYAPRESEILVIAVMHGSRRPGYWKKRLKDLGP
jgi:plasmid stabilization system protein ParE